MCRGLGGRHHHYRLVVWRRLSTVGKVPDFALLQVVEAASMAASARRGGRRSRRPPAALCAGRWTDMHRWGSHSGSGRLDSSRRSGGVAPLASPHCAHGWLWSSAAALALFVLAPLIRHTRSFDPMLLGALVVCSGFSGALPAPLYAFDAALQLFILSAPPPARGAPTVITSSRGAGR